MTPEKYDFPDQYRGTWFQRTPIEFYNDDESPMDIRDVQFKMDIKRSETSNPTKTISNGNGITIDPLSIHIIFIEGFIVDMPAYNYKQDLKMIYPNDEPYVYIRGDFPVDQNITN